jgi:hypothetical protein
VRVCGGGGSVYMRVCVCACVCVVVGGWVGGCAGAGAGACMCVSSLTCGGGPGRSASAASASPAAPPHPVPCRQPRAFHSNPPRPPPHTHTHPPGPLLPRIREHPRGRQLRAAAGCGGVERRGAVTCRIYDVTSKRRRHLVHHLQPRRPTRRAARRIVSRSRAHAWQVGAPATWPPPPPQKASHTRRRCAGQASQRAPRTLRSPSPPARSPICLRPPQPPSHVPCSRHRFAPPLLPPYNCGRCSRTFRRRLCSRTRMHGCGRGPGRIAATDDGDSPDGDCACTCAS